MCGYCGPVQAHHYGHVGCCGGGSPGSGHGMQFSRRFATSEERITRLAGYLKDLQAEAQAVEERLAELKRKA